MGNRSRLFSALSIGCSLLVASPSWAAVVEPGDGDLTVNQGQGFKPVKSSSTANVGDSVMVAPGGAATVVYDDGCKVSVQPGSVTTIAPLSPCAAGSNAQVGPSWCPPVDPAHPDQTCGWTPGTIAFGALFLGDIAALIWLISQNQNNQTTIRCGSTC
jgi:hypothetical protein